MIIDSAKLLGILFHNKKNKLEIVEIVSVLCRERVLNQPTLQALLVSDEEILSTDFTELFEGIGDMQAPPWGSVYLDRERVLFGDSTVAYRQFLDRHGIELNTGLREPEDQFGLMLLALAYLLESDKVHAAYELLECHFLPWAIVYLQRLEDISHNKFYRYLAADVMAWLNALILDLKLNVVEKKIYIDG
ncbi:molecular chaperone (plasmid) [Vibrio sp. HDW18]|uniref:molecular chaperone TorD family protein n=1 Tax=Vibrio sp. HDW18 TaxID=2714948 RepID=UPI0014086E52|nr:molecular chaperone TorD family protein [Vibrio sp. HDW18]QIL86896.1 molecular chaperone [Vibrio sp. HDW18]